jgi:hypothetical protein
MAAHQECDEIMGITPDHITESSNGLASGPFTAKKKPARRLQI